MLSALPEPSLLLDVCRGLAGPVAGRKGISEASKRRFMAAVHLPISSTRAAEHFSVPEAVLQADLAAMVKCQDQSLKGAQQVGSRTGSR